MKQLDGDGPKIRGFWQMLSGSSHFPNFHIHLIAFLIGLLSLGVTIWNCYRGIYLSAVTITPLFLLIAVPAGLLLWITWRKEIRSWVIIPSIILAACAALAVCEFWSALPNTFHSWTELSFQVILTYLARFALLSIPVFVFYGTLKFLNGLTVRFVRNRAK
jgi:hypothetical protein